jgi:hypothetical protein
MGMRRAQKAAPIHAAIIETRRVREFRCLSDDFGGGCALIVNAYFTQRDGFVRRNNVPTRPSPGKSHKNH